ncbi:cbb3-type cytochrome oxidase assembly protein CcoS [Oxalobacteraceae bacterium R-40]|uniref:Cbb3-type cytochrome oxidase assembly protein CcoS n=1 Tax=Keguizhuia sedimenti TaxID=3064264 RepID=A0ABU1BNM0_9BURK|nr:cbb3-type cytochrome oxidase assembly protein CcoS [Oxalobacteraceae bacterium R-40]
MESLYLLIPLSIVIVFIAIWVFFSMSDSGQFDDMVGPALRVLQDDDSVHDKGASEKNGDRDQEIPAKQEQGGKD